MTIGNLIEVQDVIITNSMKISISVVDIFLHITMYDGLFANSTSGEISIQDTSRLQELGTLFGDEIITIKYKDIPNGVNIERKFIMYASGTKTPNKNQKGTFCVYNFVSLDAAHDSTVRLCKTYRGTAYDIITQIWDDSGISSKSEKSLYISPYDLPEATYVFCAAGWSPFFAIRWLVSKMNEQGAADWMFYELPSDINDSTKRLGSFELRSLSDLSKENPKHAYQFGLPGLDSSPTTSFLNAAVYGIEPYDTLHNLNGGMYAATMITHDITTRKWERRNFSYSEDFAKSDHVDDNRLVNKHGGELFTTKYDIKENVVADNRNQFTEPGYFDDTPYNPSTEVTKADYFMHRTSQLRQVLYGHRLNLTLHGNSGIRSGDVLFFDMPVSGLQTETEQSHKYLSGNYLVISVSQTFTATTFQTNVQIAKNSLSTAMPGGVAAIEANEGSVPGRPQPKPGIPMRVAAYEVGNTTDNGDALTAQDAIAKLNGL
jgi:hypothetical protein